MEIRNTNGINFEIDREASDMFSRLVKQMTLAESITEQLKAEAQMEWVGRMNNAYDRQEKL